MSSQTVIHTNGSVPVRQIRARSIDGVSWFDIEIDGHSLVIHTDTPEQAQDIADGFRKAFPS